MKPLWTPSQEFVTQSNLHQFEQFLQYKCGLVISDYESLWSWSALNPAQFWESIWHYFDIVHYSPYKQVMSEDPMPGTQWFEEATLNYCEHLFRHGDEHKTALIAANEKGGIEEISWPELERQVAAVRAFLVDQGVTPGDTVAAYMPNIPATLIAFMAVNSLGAVWSCCSMDFGWNTVVDRFVQIEPKIFITANGYYYKGKNYDRSTEVRKIMDALSTIEKTLVVLHLSEVHSSMMGVTWSQVQNDYAKASLGFEAVPFNHPMWVLYSSGTTGKPKAITHSHGGMLLEHLKYMHFHNNVKSGEHFFWYTTTGWMMWNFLQSSLLAGAIPIFYEGSPAWPDLTALWKLAEKIPIHHFGTSAPYLTTLMNTNLALGQNHDLSQLKSIGSTGSPLPPAVFDYVYREISASVWLCSMSGGTDVCTAFVGGVPSKPVYRGRIQGRALGCSLQSVNSNGDPIIDQLGEMVIDQPMPCMPIYFWNDQGNEKYLEAYFSTFPGKWRHGDYIKIFADGSLIIQGRSDATLNRKGIRIGTAEIYNALEDIPQIEDSLILNIEKPNGEDIMPLFVVLSDGVVPDDTLKKKIREVLKEDCSPRHIPDLIYEVPDIPYTLSGKKMEVPVKKIFMNIGEDSNINKDAIRNPEAMDHFITIASNLRHLFT